MAKNTRWMKWVVAESAKLDMPTPRKRKIDAEAEVQAKSA